MPNIFVTKKSKEKYVYEMFDEKNMQFVMIN